MGILKIYYRPSGLFFLRFNHQAAGSKMALFDLNEGHVGIHMQNLHKY
jgi:hypothetical protein